ncbi:hypothetical protein TR2A62_1294 [Thalassobium sp. R2A62]|jgi:hypothetical protein|nr:hypothetical protein TR2A62_1294 [Thalassobium sp. R2A62]
MTIMARSSTSDQSFNIMIVGQAGRLQYEAVLFAASLRQHSPRFDGRLIVVEPQPSPKWSTDPRMTGDARTALIELGAEIVPFTNHHFGEGYRYGNKIEGLAAMPAGEPFVFFDTDTLITGELMDVPFDFDRPTASMMREGTWPKEELYWPGYTATWKSLYDKFDLEFESTLDLSQPDDYWQRYLYFNAGWFFYKDPAAFGARFLDYATAIREDRPPELVLQELNPWLDQVALPLVIHSLGGGRDTLPTGHLDGAVSYHYRLLPLLYAKAPDAVVSALEAASSPNKVKKVLKSYEPFLRMIYQNRGQKVREMFDRDDLPKREKQIRNRIKKANFWMR